MRAAKEPARLASAGFFLPASQLAQQRVGKATARSYGIKTLSNAYPRGSETGSVSLVKSKIDYQSPEKFSNDERFGRDLAHSEMRLHELRKLNTAFKELLALAADAKQNLKIDGWIERSFSER